jgi:hypothetical protein
VVSSSNDSKKLKSLAHTENWEFESRSVLQLDAVVHDFLGSAIIGMLLTRLRVNQSQISTCEEHAINLI